MKKIKPRGSARVLHELGKHRRWKEESEKRRAAYKEECRLISERRKQQEEDRKSGFVAVEVTKGGGVNTRRVRGQVMSPMMVCVVMSACMLAQDRRL